MSKTLIYGFNAGGQPRFELAMAISAGGVLCASHCCSSESFMPHDLGMDGRSDWKHDTYDKLFPDGWETEWIPTSQLEDHEGFNRAIKLAKKRAAEKKAEEKYDDQ